MIGRNVSLVCTSHARLVSAVAASVYAWVRVCTDITRLLCVAVVNTGSGQTIHKHIHSITALFLIRDSNRLACVVFGLLIFHVDGLQPSVSDRKS